MAELIPTLKTIFAITHDEATMAILKGVDKKTWRDVKMPELLLEAAAAKIGGVVDGLLTTPLPDILSGAWNRYRKYCKYADPTLFPPGTEHEELEGHFSIESKHTPRVDLMINGKVESTVKFPITLTLTFDGAVVVMRDGRFVALKTGTCTVGGTIYCENTMLKEKVTAPFVLPGVLRFAVGIPILPCV